MTDVYSIEEKIRWYRSADTEEKRQIEAQVCEAFVPLIQKIAGKYRNSSRNSAASHEDRVQDGYHGLLNALRTYDPENKAKFLTYAFNCVKKAVYSGTREINSSGKSKAYSDSRLQKYRKMKKELTIKLGRNPSIGELSIETGWRINTVLSYERQLYEVASFDDTEMSEISI